MVYLISFRNKNSIYFQTRQSAARMEVGDEKESMHKFHGDKRMNTHMWKTFFGGGEKHLI